VCKVALLGRSSKDTKVVDICTTDTKLVVAKRSDSIEVCVKKMLDSDVRHLPVVEDDSGEVFGLISVKDLVKEVRDLQLYTTSTCPPTHSLAHLPTQFTREKDDILEKLFGTKLQM
jgi:CBS domain containing-hemolysin-like protein